jgi:hypothetical protein
MPVFGRRIVGSSVAMILALLILSVAAISSANAAPHWPTHKCGSFLTQDEPGNFESKARITVLNSSGLSCRSATAVIKAFWGPENQITHHGGPSEAQSYYTINGFPGWRCTQGAGAGSCVRRHKVAAYEARNA